MKPMRVLFVSLLLCFCGVTLRADRVVLAPDASTLPPNGFKLQSLFSPTRKNENISWVQLSTPQSMELEYTRYDLLGDRRLRDSFNIQYPLLSDLGTFPAVSIGVRDLFGTGIEHLSVYGTIGKSLPLSDRQLRLWKEIKLNVGAGTAWFDGVFVGVQTRLRSGLMINAEIFRYRPNISLGLPLLRNLQANAQSLDGRLFYGLTYTLAR